MRRSDKRRAQAHLNDAVRHLAAAKGVIQQLENDAEFSAAERTELGDITSLVGSLVDQVGSALRGRTLEAELADILAIPTEDGTGPA